MARGAMEPRTATVTGAASGIGEAMTDAFTREEAQQLLADLDADRPGAAKERLGESVTVTTAIVDVTEPDDWRPVRRGRASRRSGSPAGGRRQVLRVGREGATGRKAANEPSL